MIKLKKINRIVIASLILMALSGCSIYKYYNGWAFYSYGSSYNENTKSSYKRAAMGSYVAYTKAGGQFQSSPQESFYKGNLVGEEISAYWSVINPPNNQYYHARSFPGKGVVAPQRYWWSDWFYHAYISFGPMFLVETALNEEKKLTASFIETWPSGLDVYHWGKKDTLYYKIFKKHISLVDGVPIQWNEIQAMSLTASQYNFLVKRCERPWLSVRCFVDENFPDLTPKQLAYVKAHKHPGDDDRMSGKVPAPPPSKPNRWL
jgi:hypothetical protein